MSKRSTIIPALARSGVYRWLAIGFGAPDIELAAVVRDGRLHRELATFAANLPLIEGENEQAQTSCVAALARLDKIHSGMTLERLDAENAAVFGHALSKDCPAYETEYAGTEVFRQSQELADISGFYRAFGLDLNDAARERLDHISIQLEFMQSLCAKEAFAMRNGLDEQLEICRAAQCKFIEDHLGKWSPFFAELVVQKSGDGYYGCMADILNWFVAYETARVDARPELVHRVRPESDDDDAPNVEWVGKMES
ncbi:MAG: molecular chaperone TorD family protein [Candidatus Poribacteria bacterium]|nr:molecular chaperone TorD family protein [Candidatus Poribacteria bacterium]